MRRGFRTTQVHGARSTALLLGTGALCGWLSYTILANNPTEEGVVWGFGIGAFAGLCLWSGFRGRS